MPYLPLDVPPPAEPEALDALANACLAAAEEHHTVAVGLQGVFESLSVGPERWQGHASLTYHDTWGSVEDDIARTAEALAGLAARLRWFAGAIRVVQASLRAELAAAAALGPGAPAAQEAARAAAEAAFLALDAQMGAALAELLAAIPLTRLHLGFLGGVIAEPAKAAAATESIIGELASGGPILIPAIPQPPNTPMGPITYVGSNRGGAAEDVEKLTTRSGHEVTLPKGKFHSMDTHLKEFLGISRETKLTDEQIEMWREAVRKTIQTSQMAFPWDSHGRPTTALLGRIEGRPFVVQYERGGGAFVTAFVPHADQWAAMRLAYEKSRMV